MPWRYQYRHPSSSSAQSRAFRICPVTPSSQPPCTMQPAKRIWPHLQRARPSAGFFRSIDMLFTKHSQNAAQIEQTKGFDPIQRARHARAFCCQPFQLQSSPFPRMESKLCPPRFRSLPSGNWNAQVRVKGKSPQSKTFSTKVEAESWANQIEAVTMDRKHHTIFTLGMTDCETMLKGKGSYDHALKIVEHLGRHFTQLIFPA